MRRFPVAVLLFIFCLAGTLNADVRRRAIAPGAPAESDGVVNALDVKGVNGAAITGRVASVAGSIITLSTGAAPAIRIDTTGATFVGRGTDKPTIATVVPGSRITALLDSSRSTSGALVAKVVTVETLPDLALVGPVESVDVAGGKFTVLGVTIATDSKTSYGTAFPTFAPITGVKDLAVGQTVNVDLTTTGPALLATRVFILTPGTVEGVQLRGKVKTIGADSWVITDKEGKDVTLVIDERTKISGNPRVGDEVQVIAVLDSAARHIAIVIHKLERLAPKETEVRGFVQSMASDSWTIGGPEGSKMPSISIAINSSTTIYAGPKVGDYIVAVVLPDASGKLVAKSIVKGELNPIRFEMKGTIAKMTPTLWTVSAMPLTVMVDVKITPTTVIYADPKVGDKVVIAGERDMATGVVTAYKIAKAD